MGGSSRSGESDAGAGDRERSDPPSRRGAPGGRFGRDSDRPWGPGPGGGGLPWAARRLVELLGLRTAPVAVTFQEKPPADLPRVGDPAPSGCSYWKYAAEGRSFYTEASDHYHCPVGAHTHGVDLPPGQAKELEGLVETMIGLAYLSPNEVAGIPRRDSPFGVAVYAPLAETADEPDVVLIRGNARQTMLLAEAAHAAADGSSSGFALMGRPTCAVIPEVLRTQHGAASLGCIGNRVYTGLGDDELYFALPGQQVEAVVQKLATIVTANRELEKFHRARM
jgi:uncharacterized protein (DUF169 family)